MNIKYTGAAKDFSGYGEAVRHDIAALRSVGVEVTTEIPVYTQQYTDFGKVGADAVDVELRELDYNVKILHTTPNVFFRFIEKGKYHIARAFWETSLLPDDFVSGLNLVDEIWTGSEMNKQAMIDSGVKKPIHIIPQAIVPENPEPFLTECSEDFTFYSIFEWTERKNPRALLEAYWRAFKPSDNVSLVIKTYVDGFKKENKAEVNTALRKLKASLNFPEYPKTYFYLDLMDRTQIYRLHKTFDCFVSAHRGEGWGIPQMEALSMGKLVISTNRGGVHEYLTDKKDALLIPYTLSSVQNTRNTAWYTSNQQWADVEVLKLSGAMRWAYDNQKEALSIAKRGQSLAKKVFSVENVGSLMLKRLRQIK